MFNFELLPSVANDHTLPNGFINVTYFLYKRLMQTVQLKKKKTNLNFSQNTFVYPLLFLAI